MRFDGGSPSIYVVLILMRATQIVMGVTGESGGDGGDGGALLRQVWLQKK